MKNNLKLQHLTEEEMPMLKDFINAGSEVWFEAYLISVSQDDGYTGNNLDLAFFKQRILEENELFFEEWKNKEVNKDDDSLHSIFDDSYVYECRRRFKQSLNEKLSEKTFKELLKKI